MDKLFKKLPQGINYELTGLSFQEEQSGSQAPALYALSILIIYLCLAALYESWAIPLSVMLVIPLGVIGALAAASARGLFNDIYFQVGLLATIGLSAKNAILIVEFAVDAERKGMTARAAALEAAHLRPAPHPDDLDRLYRRCVPPGGGVGRGRGQPERHRHRRDRRHVDRHHPGDFLRAGVLPNHQPGLAAPRIGAAAAKFPIAP